MFKKRTETRPENLDDWVLEDWTDEEYEDWYHYIGDGLEPDEFDEMLEREHRQKVWLVSLICVVWFLWGIGMLWSVHMTVTGQ